MHTWYWSATCPGHTNGSSITMIGVGLLLLLGWGWLSRQPMPSGWCPCAFVSWGPGAAGGLHHLDRRLEGGFSFIFNMVSLLLTGLVAAYCDVRLFYALVSVPCCSCWMRASGVLSLCSGQHHCGRGLASGAGRRDGACSTAGSSLRCQGARQPDAGKQDECHGHQDPLTGIANRRHFDQACKRAIARRGTTQMYRSPRSCSMWDFFKRYNDRYGHQAGMSARSWVGECLEESGEPGDLRRATGRGVQQPSCRGDDAGWWPEVAERIAPLWRPGLRPCQDSSSFPSP